MRQTMFEEEVLLGKTLLGKTLEERMQKQSQS
jgi:hypothetical protein